MIVQQFLSKAEEKQVLLDWNNTKRDYCLDKCLHELIQEQVIKNPDKPALRFRAEQLSYAELNSRANRCARYLQGMGVGPDSIVGVLMERSLEIVIALVGILKAGGAYLPLDPTYPEERLEFMLEDAGVSIIFTQAKYKSLAGKFNGTKFCLDSEWDYLLGESDSNPDLIATPENLAYIIYTSGSTGKPKGCMLSHQAICNRLAWMQEKYQLTDKDKVLQKTPFTFDVSVWEIFWPLLSGACLVVAKPEGHKDSNYLVEIINKERITTCHFVPSMLRFFVSNSNVRLCDTLRQVFTSGEALAFDLMMDFKDKLSAKLHNLYGPTEAAIDVTYWECEERVDKKVPIGRPISNIQIYILDDALKQVSIGEEGELHIGGIGLAKGYLNRPELSAEKFINDPFSNKTGAKLYKTGDRARYLPDGNIEFLGRIDFQVKLRGNRIEMGEIEAALREHDAIAEVVVLVRNGESSDPKLVAYIVAKGELPASKQLRDFVKKRLPAYMIPNIIMPLKAIPVTPHGKLNREALPWPTKEQIRETTAITTGKPEINLRENVTKALLEYTKEITGTDELRIEDDLFDLGATSLTMVRMVEKIKNQYGISIPVEIFLDDPTIKAIVDYLCKQLQDITERSQINMKDSKHYSDIDDSGKVTELQKADFKKAAYTQSTVLRNYVRKVIPFNLFSKFISLLKQETIQEKGKYLYPSAGGLNAVQTYLYVRENAVEGVKKGVYYYHPSDHALYLVNDVLTIDRSIFFEYDRPVFDNTGFVLFFIAQLDAITPVYQSASPSLVTLDAGYMGQLMLSRQADFGLGVCPVLGVDFDKIAAFFKLDKGHRFIHCLLGGVPNALDNSSDAPIGLAGYLQKTSKQITEHFLNYSGDKTFSSFLEFNWHTTLKNMKYLNKEEHDNFHAQSLNIRRFSDGETMIALDKYKFSQSSYILRSCQRDYLSEPVPFAQFSKFMTLLRPINEAGNSCCLYSALSGTKGIHTYLYIKENGVEGLDEGIYYYNTEKHVLALITSELSKKIKPSYTPFNRKHYQNSAFCLFLLGELDVLKPIYQEDSLYVALLEAGYMGQLLMDKQAEFDIGVCPIGGLDFDRICQEFKLNGEQVFLHSFTCGSFLQEIPKEWEFLETGRGERETVKLGGKVALIKNREAADQKDIAIVGLGGRYPGAKTLAEYWENLKRGKNSIQELPESRKKLWKNDWYETICEQKTAASRGGYLDDIECFDNLLFNISPVESRSMDPQERLFMEVVWECLENAGYTAENLIRSCHRVGVFVGAMWNDYQNQTSNLNKDRQAMQASAFHSSIANRTSYFFNFDGPSIALNTSCSSAMTAIHFACESIKRGECNAAVVGGVNLITHSYHQDLLRGLDLLSKDGECRPLGRQSSGWLPGEGVGAILLKSIEAAQQDNDYIYGVIKGTAIGHSGKTVQYGAPSVAKQSELMQKAMENAGVSAESISYIETAAAGANIADASEINAIKNVFQPHADPLYPRYIGSVKANIGHLEAASAMSQITKVLLQMQHGQIAPTIQFNPVNPLIQLQESGLEIVDTVRTWRNQPSEAGQDKNPCRALINAFGATGSAGHIILEEYIRGADKQVASLKPTLIPVSAATSEQLNQQLIELSEFLAHNETLSLADIGYTLRMGRVAMKERIAIVAENIQSLKEKLNRFLNGAAENIDGLYRGTAVSAEGSPITTDQQDLLDIAAKWVQGVRLEWSGVNDGSERRILLPTYPFAKKRHWVKEPITALPKEREPASFAENSLLAKIEDYLQEIFSEVSEIPVTQINKMAGLERYGINSLMITSLNQYLEEEFGKLPKTLFFEYKTIRELAKYFWKYHQDQAKEIFHYAELPIHAQLNDDCAVVTPKEEQIYSPVNSLELGNNEILDIAITGVSGRYPKARTLADYWENLKNGIDCIIEIPKERWDYQAYYNGDKTTPIKAGSKWGGFIDDVDKFDPLFFNISPREAEKMDPQERLFLETVWHTFEDAGYNHYSLQQLLNGKVGIFVGVMYGEYQLLGNDQLGVLSSYGSIANRVSYYFDFHGPSMSIDTICSSSLTALHLAVESIKRGECEAAIAGGVNISIHPNKYLVHSQLLMSATDGRCRSFGEGGDGFVPGEGVGAVLLKPLQQAINDGDHIYGIIKGTSVNHGGKTNGYMVPNPTAQSKLILEALHRAQIDPRTISYVEAHGTGTSLGDPIEIDGLAKSFGEYTNEKQYCSIGSVKSNIGHLESAAGIAGLTKVLLQMKNKQLVPSLHSKQLNSNINFEDTPFFVQQELTDWQQPVIHVDGQVKIYPRRASISSFGAGGANAHAVIEEYTSPPQEPEHQGQDLQMIVLSAKNEERLREYVLRFLNAIQTQQLSETRLSDIAYTLQVGREAMEERLAVVVGSVKELEEKLKQFIKGQTSIKGLYYGQAKDNQGILSVLADNKEMQEPLRKWIQQGKYAPMLELWVNGLVFDWGKLYWKSKPHRVSLPTYPFAKERYWIPVVESKAGSKTNREATALVIHPLLHKNTSDFFKQQFSSTFTGQEFFLASPILQGQRVLSGMAYLEMARAAVEQAAGNLLENQTINRLKNVMWDRPIIVEDQAIQIHIRLFPEDNGEIFYEIYSESEAEAIVHGQGRAALCSSSKVPSLDILALQAQCSQSSLRANWVECVSQHQGIEKVYGGMDQVLAKLCWPAVAFATQDQFVLHPGLMDAAWQVSAGLAMVSADDVNTIAPLKTYLPLALQELEIYSKCSASMWALVRYSDGSKAEDQVKKFDIDLCDDQGHVCVRMKGLEQQENTRSLLMTSLDSKQPSVPVPKTQENFAMMTFEEVWQEQPLAAIYPVGINTLVCFISQPANKQAILEALPNFAQQTKVIFVSQGTIYEKQSQYEYRIAREDQNSFQQVFQSIAEDYGQVDAMLYLWPLEDHSAIKDYLGIVNILQGIAAAKLKAKRFLLAAQFDNELNRCYLESWIGFERSLGLVLPNTEMSIIYQAACDQNQETVLRDWLEKIWAELQAPKLQSVLYQKEKRHVLQIRQTTLQSGNSMLKSGGTYLITGGGGGLGLLFAEYIARKHPVNLILTGRSPIEGEKQAKLKALEELGSQVLYVQADICDPKRMKEGLNQAQKRFGEINGVIHAAGVQSNQSILKENKRSFTAVLDPKIKGTLVLDNLLLEESLDFICYFSSAAAILGDFGSCDYAVANRFLIAYAHYRQQLQCQKQRQGKTVVINWPLWKDGGMGFGDDENSKTYLQSSGQRFLVTTEGMAMFERLLVQNKTQHLLLVGQPSRVHRFLGLINKKATTSFIHTPNSSSTSKRAELKGLNLAQCLDWDLKEHIGKVLKIPRDKLGRAENLADLGFDSVSLAEFALSLTNYYGIEITPALFFGHSTIDSLTQYFLQEHQANIEAFYREMIIEEDLSPRIPGIAATTKRQPPGKFRFAVRSSSQNMDDPIAIIGMSGRFPQARNIDEMWRIVTEGQDAVTAIPEERFPGPGPGKTKWKCGCISGVSEFDALFFEISPREAEIMDPRQRLLLQEAWKALEDAGYGATHLSANKIGMFVGVEEGDYHLLVKEKGSITANHTAILAARLAYFLNLNGPVMAINTACSSGLVAVHQAILSLRNRECTTAIAAGANLILTPESFIGMSQAGMLSEDGKCFAFDARANGMVPGEAVAAVVLKRLSQAESDGDPIYAIIQGSGINYDGKTNGITAPSGVAQTDLLKSVYDQYRVNPQEIEYIVTHGTGTKLGDPVEINALYNAFKTYTSKQGFCALTSTKANFGHTFAASGLVSLICLVQALRYGIIPPSLHYEQKNDYIRWQESPFYVNQVARTWPEREGRRRSGAVSAFGMSGTNVHMVVQGYTSKEAVTSSEQGPYYHLLAFSAKTPAALQEKIQDIIDAMQNSHWSEKNLPQISYTLLAGRQHFAHRCAIIVRDLEDALYQLKKAGRKEELPRMFHGTVPRNFSGQKLIVEYTQYLLEHSQSVKGNKNKYREVLCALADFYCQGYEISWNSLYSIKPRRISLPPYPFTKENYWVAEIKTRSASNMSTSSAVITFMHPLLHQNSSDFTEQRFSSTFTGQEFFLADHVVKGQRVLPGVAYLEMARAAVEQATGATAELDAGIQLKNIVWSCPVVVGEKPVQVHIGLCPEDNGEISYQIYRKSTTDNAEPVVYSRGRAVPRSASEASTLDIPFLQSQCGQSSLSSYQCYEAFRALGFDYGPAHQGIEVVYVGAGQVLAKLSLPLAVSDTNDQFVLHPSLLDAALQASIGLMLDSDKSLSSNSGVHCRPILPFALQELNINGKCTAVMWALIRYSKDSKAGDNVQKIDIDLSDAKGTICVQMKGLTLRLLEGEVGEADASATFGTLMLHPCWKESVVVQAASEPAYAQHILVLCEPGEVLRESIEKHINGVSCLLLQSQHEDIAERFQTYAVQMFTRIQSILQNKLKGTVLIQLVVPIQEARQLFSGLFGLLKTAQLENPKLIGQLIELGSEEDSAGIVEKLMQSSRNPIDNQVRYQHGTRWIAGWSEIEVPCEVMIPWKDQGVYLITGGVGGLGLIFAKEIAQKVKAAVLILTGRSPLNEDKKAKLKELQALGAQIIYKQLDVTQKEAVYGLIQSIQEGYGSLHGIIHSAGVIRDNFIIKKTKEEVQEVLAPKVRGLVNLDQASKNLSLDFFILFSSIAGSIGNIGQADYATANAFMDAYAKYRNSLVSLEQRQGQTISINWSLWKEGGMHVARETRIMAEKDMDMIALTTVAGIKAFYHCLASKHEQVMVMEGKLTGRPTVMAKNRTAKMRYLKEHTITKKQSDVPENENIKARMIAYLKQILSNTLKLDPDRMDINESLEKYGLDSIMVIEINNKVEQHFPDLSKALFFEYSTIDDLADYFIEAHKESVDKIFQSPQILNQTEFSANVLQQDNQNSKHIVIKPFSKSKRIKYLAKQNNSDIKYSSAMLFNQQTQKDDILNVLVNQIETSHFFNLDDIIKFYLETKKEMIQVQNSVYNPKEEFKEQIRPLLIHEKELQTNPEIAKLILDIDNKYPPAGYERLLYPYFFISATKDKYIRVIIDEALIIPFFSINKDMYQELQSYCQQNQQQLLIVDCYHDWLISNGMKLIPLGVWQNLDVKQFSLAGNKMRKLRYLVEKFKKCGEVKTEEYHNKSKMPINEMKDLMMKWSESKKNIIHHSYICMAELLQQSFSVEHRAFLTFHNKKLCSVIVIGKIENGIYIMDQEFYDPQTAPLGHMEYAILQIIEQLKIENAKIFSLGLTWYPFVFEDHPANDAGGWVWLKEQNKKQALLSRIFYQGETNYQFKKKFGVIGEPIFAYIPKNTPYSFVLNYWTVFYQNSLTFTQLAKQIDEISLLNSDVEKKSENSIQINHNLNENKFIELLVETDKLEQLAYNSSPLDLMTDSWFVVRSDAVKERITYLKTKPQQETIELLHTIFPFKHIILTTQGRIAEQIFYQAYPKEKTRILTTVSWTTSLKHQLSNGFDVIELPDLSVIQPQSAHLFKGEMNLEALNGQLEKESDNIALAGLELLNNASGGHPVRYSHICQLKSILQQYKIPLVLDASRIVRNAFLSRQYENGYNQNNVWDIVNQTLQQAEHVVTSLTKDFAVPVGGLIATNDSQLATDIRNIQIRDGLTIPTDCENMIIQALSEKETILCLIAKQIEFTKRLQDMLIQARVSILQPAYGHAIVINISQFIDGETNTQKKQQFLKQLFLKTGIRGSIHQVGKQKNTILDQCIRLAIPLGLTKMDEENIYNKLHSFFN
ncbi:amino acid adenylation domain-containing protein|uniref:Amino acid adenylation domain-containing protein n=1 Tax=Dendrosporobacter quercicolus TaxID=146817 RepID=A0A1G9KMU5_9FIRM|nr:amino acid adenylation domain-containing protein [Dendrosporobacter quercicolus]NSL46456.1 amino acid adenylation domain-containing protein [Dendrosporobacter quercicolus DSM 1736]SDL51088.1 amino acid adenylation domain-containing protein [Dendrosporobacter quercicolus]